MKDMNFLSRPFSAFLLLTWFVAFPKLGTAQRPDRPNLNDMTAQDQETLAQLILEWITEPMNTEHGTNPGFTDIHNTNNFLPWHRMHIREIEDYINTVNPMLLAPTGLLPYYDPFNQMPLPFLDRVDEFVQQSEEMNPNPDLLSDFINQICEPDYHDVGFFSDVLENGYHSAGHGAMGGPVLNQNFSAACAIFWPWHAWIDEFWYRWERDCSGEYTKFDLADNKVEITGTETWTTDQWVKGIIEVRNGGVLTITNGAVVHFAPSDYNARVSKIVVKTGGTLVVDNATLTGISMLGDGGFDGTDPSGVRGVKYHSGWEGVLVEGNNGLLIVRNDAVIEHATKAVETINGGRVLVRGAWFLNNRFDFVFGNHKKSATCSVVDADMINDAPLRDIVWVSAPVGGFEKEHHINHEDTHSSEVHVSFGNIAGGVHGNVWVKDSRINNLFQDEHGHYVSIGVRGLESKYLVQGCEIKNQTTGVEGGNFTPGPNRDAHISGNHFINNRLAVNLAGVDYSTIDEANVFEIPKNSPQVPPSYVPIGLFAHGSVSMTVKDNEFKTVNEEVSTTNFGAIISNSSPNALYPFASRVGDKAALMLEKSELGNIVPGTFALISNLSASDPNKVWLNLKHNLMASGRSFDQLTPAELALVEAEASPFTKSGTHGKAILKALTGQPIPIIVEPIITDRQLSKQLPQSIPTAMQLSPNPTSDRTTIRFDVFGHDGQAQINLFDLNGRLIRNLTLAGFPEAVLDTSGLPAGLYMLQLRRDGLVVDTQKLVVIR